MSDSLHSLNCSFDCWETLSEVVDSPAPQFCYLEFTVTFEIYCRKHKGPVATILVF